jgi:putative MATE family efflux protein
VATTDTALDVRADVSENVTGDIVRMAWPVVVERLSVSVLAAVDAALVGTYVGDEGLAAVGLGTLLFWIPLAGAFAIDVGSTAIMARDAGAGERSRAQAGLHAAVVSAFIWGAACAAIVFALAPQLIRLMGAEPEVVPHGVEFLRAGCLGFPMLMVLYAISGSLRGMGNTWMPMVILIIVNLINAGLTFVLINGSVADLGTQASGIGYAVGGSVGGALALALVMSSLAPVRMDVRRLLPVRRDALRRLLRIGLPVGLQEMQFMLAFLVYTRIVATLGTQQLAAHSLALRSLEIAILPAFALETASTALVSRALGAGRPAHAERVAMRTTTIAVGVLVSMAALQFALAPYAVRLFVDDSDVQQTGTRLLRVFAFAIPALGIHAPLSGALRGAGDARFVLGTFTLTTWAVRVPIAALTALVLGLSVPYVWLAALTENWTRAALVVRRFRQGRWKTMRV